MRVWIIIYTIIVCSIVKAQEPRDAGDVCSVKEVLDIFNLNDSSFENSNELNEAVKAYVWKPHPTKKSWYFKTGWKFFKAVRMCVEDYLEEGIHGEEIKNNLLKYKYQLSRNLYLSETMQATEELKNIDPLAFGDTNKFGITYSCEPQNPQSTSLSLLGKNTLESCFSADNSIANIEDTMEYFFIELGQTILRSLNTKSENQVTTHIFGTQRNSSSQCHITGSIVVKHTGKNKVEIQSACGTVTHLQSKQSNGFSHWDIIKASGLVQFLTSEDVGRHIQRSKVKSVCQ